MCHEGYQINDMWMIFELMMDADLHLNRFWSFLFYANQSFEGIVFVAVDIFNSKDVSKTTYKGKLIGGVK